MKNLISVLVLIFLFSLLFCEENTGLDVEHFSWQKDEIMQETRPFISISLDNKIMNFHSGNEAEIIYDNSIPFKPQDNPTNTEVTLHFNSSYPTFLIINNDFYINSLNVTWLDGYTAICSVPEGFYNIYTLFTLFNPRLVLNYSIDLTNGTTQEIYIDYDEATIPISLEGCDINGNPFETSWRYHSSYYFEFYDDDFFLSFHTLSNDIIVSELLGNFQFYAAEINSNEQETYVTQYGPINSITNNLILSNDPTEYIHQSLSLILPDTFSDLKVSVSPTFWTPADHSYMYMSSVTYADLYNCQGTEWQTELYMMEHLDTSYNSTFKLILGTLNNTDFNTLLFSAPFHCLQDGIGTFYNVQPIASDYISPNNGKIELGNPPIFQKVIQQLFYNTLTIYPEIYGYNNESRSLDYGISTYSLYNSNNTLISSGALSSLSGMYVPDDVYSLKIVVPQDSISGLEGFSMLINTFDSSLQYPNPPLINSFKIFNSGGEVVNQLDQNENASVMFTLADVEYIDDVATYFPVITDSVKVFCGLNGSGSMQEFPVEFLCEFPSTGWSFGKVFSVDLSDATNDTGIYDLQLHCVDNENNSADLFLLPAFSVEEVTGITNKEIISANRILSNYPNPFNPSTTISFNIEQNEIYELSIFNIKGQKIRTFSNYQITDSINQQIVWNGCDENNGPVSSGIYFYCLKINGNIIASKKCLLLK